MNIYAIADLHLAISVPDKSMGLFGKAWDNYMERLEQNWREICKDEDVIIIPGDISWAMNVKDMYEDLFFLEKLPGTKILLKGNHDYWWETAAKLEKFKEEHNLTKIFFIHNNNYKAGNIAICGNRGWINPDDKKFTEEDMKLYKRELMRFQFSIESAVNEGCKDIIAATHYSPFSLKSDEHCEYIEILKKYEIKQCVFGHIHKSGYQFEMWKDKAEKLSEKHKIDFRIVSADFLEFRPLKLL